MRNGINKTAKKIGVLGFFLAIAFFSNAQSSTENSAWMVSKDVQKIANKRTFQDETLRNSHIQATLVSPTWMISKGVQQTTGSEVVAKGNIESKGIPAWTISKAVQRTTPSEGLAKGNIKSNGIPVWTISKGVQQIGKK